MRRRWASAAAAGRPAAAAAPVPAAVRVCCGGWTICCCGALVGGAVGCGGCTICFGCCPPLRRLHDLLLLRCPSWVARRLRRLHDLLARCGALRSAARRRLRRLHESASAACRSAAPVGCGGCTICFCCVPVGAPVGCGGCTICFCCVPGRRAGRLRRLHDLLLAACRRRGRAACGGWHDLLRLRARRRRPSRLREAARLRPPSGAGLSPAAACPSAAACRSVDRPRWARSALARARSRSRPPGSTACPAPCLFAGLQPPATSCRRARRSEVSGCYLFPASGTFPSDDDGCIGDACRTDSGALGPEFVAQPACAINKRSERPSSSTAMVELCVSGRCPFGRSATLRPNKRRQAQRRPNGD